jgi:hypothetical protein
MLNAILTGYQKGACCAGMNLFIAPPSGIRFEVFIVVRRMMFFWVLVPCRPNSRCIYCQVYMAPKPRKT